MSFPKYEVTGPSGATIQLGSAPATPIQPDDKRWCTLEDAKAILKVFNDLGVTDAMLLDASVATVAGEHWNNVPAASTVRPWYLFSSRVSGPVGPALWEQYGPNPINGGGRGNPGAWEGVLTGNPHYVPVPVPGLVNTPPPIDSSKDPAAFNSAENVPTVVYSQADRDMLTALYHQLVPKVDNAKK